MPLSSSNTGYTDFRDTEVQQPNTTSTFSFSISSRAFSANSGQSEAGSTTTGSSCLPSRPPCLFCSSIRNSMTSFSAVSLMAIVPDSECRMPTLTVSPAWAAPETANRPASRQAVRDFLDKVIFYSKVKFKQATIHPDPARSRPEAGLLNQCSIDSCPYAQANVADQIGCAHLFHSRVKAKSIQ